AGSFLTMQFWKPTDVVQQVESLSAKNASGQSFAKSLRADNRVLQAELEASRTDVRRLTLERDRLLREVTRSRERLSDVQSTADAAQRALEVTNERATASISRARAAERAANARTAEAAARSRALEEARNALGQSTAPLGNAPLASAPLAAPSVPQVPSVSSTPDRAVGFGSVDGGGQVASVPATDRIFVAKTPGLRLEDLSRHYGVPMGDLMAVNPGLTIRVTQDGHFLNRGARVNIPEQRQ
ncbi:MAG: hypothetical protein AAF220_13645, partial [Pseudomonadota bacterium]